MIVLYLWAFAAVLMFVGIVWDIRNKGCNVEEAAVLFALWVVVAVLAPIMIWPFLADWLSPAWNKIAHKQLIKGKRSE